MTNEISFDNFYSMHYNICALIGIPPMDKPESLERMLNTLKDVVATSILKIAQATDPDEVMGRTCVFVAACMTLSVYLDSKGTTFFRSMDVDFVNTKKEGPDKFHLN